MPEHVLIDGNNLLYAMFAHAPLPTIGRETMVKVIERWARQGDDEVTLVFDGPVPRGGLFKQMASSRITVSFSAPATADDVIVSLIERAKDPGSVRVVTADTAIRHAAGLRRCRHTDSVAFVHELFDPKDDDPTPAPPLMEKPQEPSAEEAKKWLDLFGIDDDDDPFEGHDAMKS